VAEVKKRLARDLHKESIQYFLNITLTYFYALKTATQANVHAVSGGSSW
jgi:hypothetical protein